jgi:ribosome biogenesis protein Nip4
MVVVNPDSEQRFLYGKHVKSKDVVWASDLLGEEIVAVYNESDECIGYGKVLTNSSIIKKLGEETVVKNLDDLGWYLRHGG